MDGPPRSAVLFDSGLDFIEFQLESAYAKIDDDRDTSLSMVSTQKQYYRCPELLAESNNYTDKCDVYSFAGIMLAVSSVRSLLHGYFD